MSVQPYVAVAPPAVVWVEVLWLDQSERTFSICGRSPKWLRGQRKYGLRIHTIDGEKKVGETIVRDPDHPRHYVLHSELIAFLKTRAVNNNDDEGEETR